MTNPDSKVHGANMGPTWVLSAPDGPHVGPMNLAIREWIPHTKGQQYGEHFDVMTSSTERNQNLSKPKKSTNDIIIDNE